MPQDLEDKEEKILLPKHRTLKGQKKITKKKNLDENSNNWLFAYFFVHLFELVIYTFDTRVGDRNRRCIQMCKSS